VSIVWCVLNTVKGRKCGWLIGTNRGNNGWVQNDVSGSVRLECSRKEEHYVWPAQIRYLLSRS